MHEPGESERIPVNVYRAGDRVLIAALMPGLEPDDILVEVTADGRLSLHGLWGSLLEDEVPVLAEWAPGPYHREIELPGPVDGGRADLTYRSGVLVVALPVAEQTRPARLVLRGDEADRAVPTDSGPAGPLGRAGGEDD